MQVGAGGPGVVPGLVVLQEDFLGAFTSRYVHFWFVFQRCEPLQARVAQRQPELRELLLLGVPLGSGGGLLEPLIRLIGVMLSFPAWP